MAISLRARLIAASMVLAGGSAVVAYLAAPLWHPINTLYELTPDGVKPWVNDYVKVPVEGA